MNDDRKAVVSYVQSLRNLSLFSSEYLKFKNIYEQGFEKDVSTQESQKEAVINNLEQILNKNPHAKDVLYSLYLLYSEKGEIKLAQEYLEQAKAIDPSLK